MDRVCDAILRAQREGKQLQPDPIRQKNPGLHGKPLPEPAQKHDHADAGPWEQRKVGPHQGADGARGSDHWHRRVRVHGPLGQKARDPQGRKEH